MIAIKPNYPIFCLKNGINEEHKLFFSEHGFLHFEQFLNPDQVQRSLNEIHKVQSKLIAENIKELNGIPVYWGVDYMGNQIIHRMPFTSLFSEYLSSLLHSKPIQSLINILEGQWRIGEYEKDGLVVNQYSYHQKSKMKSMGWHTDSIRDVFYAKKIFPMVNIGIHLYDSNTHVGNLKVLPGTHKQSIWKLLTRKLYYLDGSKDKHEVDIQTAAGDLTIHHGYLWHRVDTPEIFQAEASRVVMYIPIICGEPSLKNEKSPTPLYHKIQKLYR